MVRTLKTDRSFSRDVVTYLKSIVSDKFTGKLHATSGPLGPGWISGSAREVVVDCGRSVSAQELPGDGRIDVPVEIVCRPRCQVEDSQGTANSDVSQLRAVGFFLPD